MHGTASNLTDDFIRMAKEAEPDVMIVEGTHINYSQISSEDVNIIKF